MASKKRLVVDKDGWVMMAKGYWAKQVGPDTFRIEYDPDFRLWYCRLNHEPAFDAARTLTEAKGYCRKGG